MKNAILPCLRFPASAAASLAVFFALAGSAPAQDAPDSGAVIRTETRVVLVDTVVTDKKGNYVRNLAAKDFKVWEDNKEQAVKTFTFESDPASPNHAQRRYIVLFFDNSTMDFGAQSQARQAAAKFIDANAAPNRMMAIVNFGGALQVAQNFTDDAARLKQIVSGQKIASVSPNGDASMGTQLSNAAADFGARDMLLALRSLAKNLNAVPGRKTLILFTGGFPLTQERIAEATATIDMCNRSNVAIYPIDSRGLVSGAPPVAQLNAAPSSRNSLFLLASFTPGTLPGMSFFQGRPTSGGGTGGGTGGRTGGTTGGRTGGVSSPAPAPGVGRGAAPPGGLNNGRLNNMNGIGPPSQARNILIPKMPESPVDTQNIMHMLADGTGGFVIRDTNDLFAGLEKIGKEMDEYYVLGYTPPESAEGSCHSLRVKVDQGRTTVRARSGYCNSKPRDLLAGNPVEKTLENRAAASQAGTVAASMQLPFFYTAPNVARVNVAMEIPSSIMKFDKQKGKFHAEMNVLGIAYNPNGSVSARFSDTVKRDFEDKKQVEAFETAPFHYENEFEVGAGQYHLKVVFSSGGADFGKLEAPLVIDPWQSQFGLSAIALSRQIRKQTDLAQSLDASLIEDQSPLITQGVQVIPAGSTHFAKTDSALFYAEVYEPLLQNPDPNTKTAIGIQIRILDRKTNEQKFSSGVMRLDIPEKTDNPMVPIAERMPIDLLVSGQYRVELQAMDSKGGQATRTADFDLQ